MRLTENTRLGTHVVSSVGGETVKAFIPPPLPPQPAVNLSGLVDLLDGATAALGRLDGVTTVLPAPPLFIYMYVRKEALLSSQIEGTQSSLSDLLLFESEEIPQVPIDDVEEVSSYVAALNHGLRRIREDGFPVSLHLIREIHGVLLRRVAAAANSPASFGAHKTGLAARDRATQPSCRRLRTSFMNVSTRSSAFCTRIIPPFHCS